MDFSPGANFAFSISDGAQGVRETVAWMRRIVRHYKRDPAIVGLARSITNGAGYKDYTGEIECLFSWVRGNIRYVEDPEGVELLSTPDRLIEMGAGDCDEQATLMASLLGAVNKPTRFKAVGLTPGDLTHVYAQVKIGDEWMALDTTEPYPMGWEPPDIRNIYIMYN